MKNSIYIVFLIILFQSCKEKFNTDNKAIDLIKKVERGHFTTPVYIEGNPTSSIEERMEHYGVPGVSIAVVHNAEAFVKAGKIDLAILNYSKSIALNPKNNRARKKRKELQKSESNED